MAHGRVERRGSRFRGIGLIEKDCPFHNGCSCFKRLKGEADRDTFCVKNGRPRKRAAGKTPLPGLQTGRRSRFYAKTGKEALVSSAKENGTGTFGAACQCPFILSAAAHLVSKNRRGEGMKKASPKPYRKKKKNPHHNNPHLGGDPNPGEEKKGII